MHRIIGLAVVVGCAPTGAPVGGCDDAEPWVGEACDDVGCGGPIVEIGTGDSGFTELVGGLPKVPIVRGGQPGYHIGLSVRMERLCPVVFVRARVDLAPAPGAGRTTMFSTNRHVQAVRLGADAPDFDAGRPSLQDYWGMPAFVPCEHWPADTSPQAWTCSAPQSSHGFIEEQYALITVEVEDHDGRVASDSIWVNPEFDPEE